jgi:hypothetical protein
MVDPGAVTVVVPLPGNPIAPRLRIVSCDGEPQTHVAIPSR